MDKTPRLTTTPMQVVTVHAMCECGGEYRRQAEANILIPYKRHVCDRCGDEWTTFGDAYPRIEFVDATPSPTPPE